MFFFILSKLYYVVDVQDEIKVLLLLGTVDEEPLRGNATANSHVFYFYLFIELIQVYYSDLNSNHFIISKPVFAVSSFFVISTSHIFCFQ